MIPPEFVRTSKASGSLNNDDEVAIEYSCFARNSRRSSPRKCSIILSSAATNWRSLIVEEHHVPYLEWKGGKFVDHVVGVNLGQPVTSEVKTRGRLRRILNKTGSISLFPSPCGTIALHAMAEGPYARCRLSCIADSG